MIAEVNINNIGEKNIANNGYISGDCITGDKVINIKFVVMETQKILDKINETVEALNNISKSNLTLAEAILKQSEANIIKARADENNSLANLNMSKSLLKDKELIEKLVNILESYKK
nr:MAG TPA: hypothetical protein [Caudoviricetes sp.]